MSRCVQRPPPGCVYVPERGELIQHAFEMASFPSIRLPPHVRDAGLTCTRLCDKYDLLIPGFIVAVFHIIDSKQRYRQAERRRLAAAPAGGMGL